MNQVLWCSVIHILKVLMLHLFLYVQAQGSTKCNAKLLLTELGRKRENGILFLCHTYGKLWT